MGVFIFHGVRVGYPPNGISSKTSCRKLMFMFWWLIRRVRVVHAWVLQVIWHTMGLDWQDRLMRLSKWLPATVSGFCAFIYVYGYVNQRYRRTYLACYVWYVTLSWSPYNKVTRAWQRVRAWWVPYVWPRRYPTVSPYTAVRVPLLFTEPTPTFTWGSSVPTQLADNEVWSNEAGFPVVEDEPFQDITDEYFEQQQDVGIDEDDEPYHEGDLLYATREGPQVEEDGKMWWRPQYHPFRGRQWEEDDRWKRKEYFVYEEQVDAFHPHERYTTGLERWVTPGDGPDVQDAEEHEVENSRWETLADWHHGVTSYKRISQGPLDTGHFTYLLTEHRLSWMTDPAYGHQHGWLKMRGLTPWLHRDWRDRWGKMRLHEVDEAMDTRSRRLYRGPRARRVHLNGHPRGGFTTRSQRRKLKFPMWRPGQWVTPWLLKYLMEEVPFSNTRWAPTRWLRWALRLRLGLQRLSGGTLRRRNGKYPRLAGWQGWKLRRMYQNLHPRFGTWLERHEPAPRKSKTSKQEIYKHRQRTVAWHAPRYDPLYRYQRVADWVPGRPRAFPASGVAVVAALSAALWVGVVVETYGMMWAEWGMHWALPRKWSHQLPIMGNTGLARWETPQWSPDFFLRVTVGLPEWWEVARLQSPRGERTTPAYRPWDYHVGDNWRHNPGLDLNLFVHTVGQNWSTTLHPNSWIYIMDSKTETLTHKAAEDRRGIVLFGRGFQFYYAKFLPSYAHWDDAIDDSWVHRKEVRWMDGYLEPFTIRREIDLRYNKFSTMPGWFWTLYLEPWEENGTAEWIIRHHTQFGFESLRYGLNLPMWVSPRGNPQFAHGYLTYWSDLTRTVSWPSFKWLNLWPRARHLGLTDHLPSIGMDVSHTNEWWWSSLPTQWEPHFNAQLVSQWATPSTPPVVSWWIPTTVFSWWNVFVHNLVNTFYQTCEWWRLIWYIAGVAVAVTSFSTTWWTTRIVPVVKTTPITRGAPTWVAQPSHTVKRRPWRLSPSQWTQRRRVMIKVTRSRLRLRFNRRARTPLWRRLLHDRDTTHPGRTTERSLVTSWVSQSVTTTVSGATPSRVAPLTVVGHHLARHSVGSSRSLTGKWYTPVTPHRWDNLLVPVGSTTWLNRPATTAVVAAPGVHPERPRKHLRKRGWYTRPGRRYRPGRIPARRRPRKGVPRGWKRSANPTLGLGRLSVTTVITHPPQGRYHLSVLKRQRVWRAQRYRSTCGTSVMTAWATPAGVAHAVAQLSGVNYPGRLTLWENDDTPTAATVANDWMNEDDSPHYIHQGDNDDDDGGETWEIEMDADEPEGLGDLSLFTTQLTGVSLHTTVVNDYLRQRSLVSWARYNALPLEVYQTIGVADFHTSDPWPSATTHWPIYGVDHPAYLLPQLTLYAVSRWARELTKLTPPVVTATPGSAAPSGTTVLAPTVTAGVYQRWSPRGGDLVYPTGVDSLFEELHLTGWAVFDTEVDPHGLFDDDDMGVEFGGVGHSWGYRWSGPGGYLSLGYRLEYAPLVWTSGYGINGWRYLVGETTTTTVLDHERVWLEKLTATYIDGYNDADLLWTGEELPMENDDLREQIDDLEEDEEVPTTLPTGFPTAVLAFALAGASPGGTGYMAAATRLSVPAGRGEALVGGATPYRLELRWYYQRYRRLRRKTTRRLRRGHLRRHLKFGFSWLATGKLTVQQTFELPGLPTVGDDVVVGVSPAEGVALDTETPAQEHLRLWALTEIYLGDYPTGAAVDS